MDQQEQTIILGLSLQICVPARRVINVSSNIFSICQI